MAFRSTIKNYYALSKPGIIYANVITALAGYFLASRFHIHSSTLAGLLIGLALVIAGACAYNNYLDQGIDKAMARTKKRSLITGEIAGWQAVLFATICSVAGIGLLLITQNWLTVVLAVIALFDYVILYGLGKRYSEHGTLIGCIAGAIPLVAGYTAVTGRIDLGAGLLFFVMVAWQMAHFYGIALYRLDDYKAARIPVMPAVCGETSTKRQVSGYIVAFVIACLLLSIFGYIGVSAGVVLAVIGLVWLYKGVHSYAALPAAHWGRQMFLFSLIVMLTMSVTLSVGPLLA